MDVSRILEIINDWRKDPFFAVYYRAGRYHKMLLSIIGLNSLEDLKKYVLNLEHTYEVDLSSMEDYLKIDKDIESAKNIHEFNQQLYIHDSIRREENHKNHRKNIAEIQKRKEPFHKLEKEDRLKNEPFEVLERFCFIHFRPTWRTELLPNVEEFITKLRKFEKIEIFTKKEPIKNWMVVLRDALNFNGYHIAKGNDNKIYRPRRHDRRYYSLENFDYYELLSAHIIAIERAVKSKSYRIDELGRVQIDLKNSIIANLSIELMSSNEHYNEVNFGEIYLSNPSSYLGYDNRLYILEYLSFFYNGYYLDFTFEAYSILMNGSNTEPNASSRLYDDEQEYKE